MNILPIPAPIRTLLIDQLVKMQDLEYVPDHPGLGICYNLHQALYDHDVDGWAYDVVATYSVDWPGRWGRIEDVPPGFHTGFKKWCGYPIVREYTPDGDRVPHWQGKQLDARRSLMRYLVERLRADEAAD